MCGCVGREIEIGEREMILLYLIAFGWWLLASLDKSHNVPILLEDFQDLTHQLANIILACFVLFWGRLWPAKGP